jgi:hypothetical protein
MYKTLKIYYFILTGLVFSLNVSAQSLFFENIHSSEWTSEVFLNDSALAAAAEIGLARLKSPADSLKANRSIWKFEEVLSLSYYNASRKLHKISAVYAYEIDPDKSLLIIKVSPSQQLVYKVAMVSTGSFVLLVRKRK